MIVRQTCDYDMALAAAHITSAAAFVLRDMC